MQAKSKSTLGEASALRYSPRLTIGKDSMHPFAGLSDHDIFRTLDGKVWVWVNGSKGSLWPVNADGSTCYANGPHPQFRNLEGYSEFVAMVNHFANNPESLA